MTIYKKGSTLSPWMWMARARQQLELHLEEGTSELSSFSSSSFVHHSKACDIYFNAMRDRVALESPYPILPSMALPPGHAFASYHPDGTPVLLYRDNENSTQIHAHVNACRHRGSPLLPPTRWSQTENAHNKGPFFVGPTRLPAPRFTCPYHAWTYDAASGDLKRIPGYEKAFGGEKLDTSLYSLKALDCQEQGGMIWVGGTKMREQHGWKMTEMEAALQPFVYQYNTTTTSSTSTTNHNNNNQQQQMTPLLPSPLPDHASTILGYREWILPVNWQLAVETLLESYHVKYLHAKTLHRVTHPTWAMVSDVMDDGRNIRHVVPLRNFVPQPQQHLEWTKEDTQRFLAQTTTTFFVFPATAISIFKRFILFTTFEPVMEATTTIRTASSSATPPSTSSKIRSWAMPHPWYDPSSLESQDNKEYHQAIIRDYESVMAAVQEDWDCVTHIQKGLHRTATSSLSSSPVEFVYGGYEGNNVQFLHHVGLLAQGLGGV